MSTKLKSNKQKEIGKTIETNKTTNEKTKYNEVEKKIRKNIGQKHQAIKIATKTEKKIIKNKMTKQEIDGKIWGNNLITNDKWPNVNDLQYIRVLYQNVNGISYYNKYNEWEIVLDVMDSMQADVISLNEINLDMTLPNVKYNLMSRLKKMDRNAKMSVSASASIKSETPFKMGGTLTYARGNISGRIVEYGNEKLGRWSYIKLIGKNGRKLKVITTYRVGRNKGGADNCTIRTQQEYDLQERYGKIVDPRKQLLEDLKLMIQKEHSNGTIIILNCDMNENIQNSKTVKNFLMAAGLKIAHTTIHDETLPNTHDRGQHCIDIMAVSTKLPNEAIVRAGILPFYSGLPSDHRAMYLDIDINYIFTNLHTDTTRYIYKRFSTKHSLKTDRYLYQLECDIEDAKIPRKIDKLEEKICLYVNKKKGKKDEMIEQTKKLFNKVTELMKSSDKKVGRLHYNKGYPHSPQLKTIANKLIKQKSKLRQESIKINKDENVIKKLVQEIKETYKELRTTQKRSSELRKTYLNELAQKRSAQWNMTSGQAATIIEAAEESRELHKKHRYYVKPQGEDNIKHLLVPAPITNWIQSNSDITNSKCQTRVDNPCDMFNILLRQNFRHLMKSENSIFTKGKLADDVGRNAENKIVEDILNGIDKEKIIKDYSDGNSILTHFIEAIRSPIKIEKDNINPMEWKYGVDEYKDTFSKTCENTACGPSGLHMSHWKAALERENIMRIHSFFVWAAFTLGFSYERWEISLHCMLKKKKHPYSQKLRIIQLFEGDFNGALKYLLGRKLMRYITSLGIIDNGTYGSRLGKTANEAILTLQVVQDNHRIWKRNMALLFNDADGCYDRIPPNLGEIALRRIGCPKSIASTHTITQRRMKHYVKTAFGTSEGYIQYQEKIKRVLREGIGMMGMIIALLGPIGGVGQGGGASPIIWLAVLLIMIEAYKKMNTGTEITDRITLVKIIIWILSYVDDNSLLKSFEYEESMYNILRQMKKCLLNWNTLLQYTGGDLCLEKCVISVMKWESNYWGIQRMVTKATHPGTITIPGTTGKEEELVRLDPNESERTLGVRMPMNGTFNKEYNFRKQQIENLGHKMYYAPFTPRDAWIVYHCRYKTIIRYALPITTFNTDQLHEIQKKFIYLLLPKIGLNRHMPRAVIYGPKKYGGREIMDIRLEQPILHYLHNLGHLRRKDMAGKALSITLNDTQLESGLIRPFQEYNSIDTQYVTKNTRWRYFWKVCDEYKLNLKVYNQWLPIRKFENDKGIMDELLKDETLNNKKNRWRLEYINNCRMYLGVIFISDMMSSNGTVHRNLLNGEFKTNRKTEYNYPSIQKPPQSAWSEWKRVIVRNFLAGPYMVNPKLYNHLKTKKYDKNETELSELTKVKKMDKITNTLQNIPKSYKDIMGTVIFPPDECHNILNNSTMGKLIGASDGSLHHGDENTKGGCGYTLQRYNTDEGKICGYASAPRSNDMSSLTTEFYGLLSILVILKVLEIQQNNKTLNNGRTIDIFIDNKEVVEKMSDESPPLNIKECLSHEYDIWKQCEGVRKLLSTPVKIKWIKGHQNETKEGHLLYGPFNRPTQLNIEVDGLATKGTLQLALETKKRPVFSTTVMSIYDKNNIQIGDLRKYMVRHINGTILLNYIKEKFEWNNEICEKINWDGIEGALKSLSEYRKTKMTQLMFNWQNVGRQKRVFGEGEGKCPAGCGRDENYLHYLYCDAFDLKQFREKQLLILKKNLDKIGTYAGISCMILQILRKGIKAVRSMEKTSSNYEDKTIDLAIIDQLEFGEGSLERGFLSKNWQRAQEIHTSGRIQKYKQAQWGAKLTKHILLYTYEIWQKRNEYIHGKTMKESMESKRILLKKEVKKMYERDRKNLTEKEKRYFKLPMNQRQKNGLEGMKLWLKLTEAAFNRADNDSQKKLTRWIKTKKETTEE